MGNKEWQEICTLWGCLSFLFFFNQVSHFLYSFIQLRVKFTSSWRCEEKIKLIQVRSPIQDMLMKRTVLFSTIDFWRGRKCLPSKNKTVKKSFHILVPGNLLNNTYYSSIVLGNSHRGNVLDFSKPWIKLLFQKTTPE